MKKIFLFSLLALDLLGASSKITSNELAIGRRTGEDIAVKFEIGNGPINPGFRWNNLAGRIEFSGDGVNYFGVDAVGNPDGINLLTNPGFELGLDNWSASGGSFATTVAVGEVGFGGASSKWNPTASGQTVKSNLEVVPNVLEGNACLARINYSWDTGTLTHIIVRVDDSIGTPLTGEIDLPVTSGGVWKKVDLEFACPSSESVRIVLESKANATEIILDQMHIGDDIRGETADPLRLAAGSIGAPSFSFVGDEDSGLYRSSADVVGISAGGANKMTFGAWVQSYEQLRAANGTEALPSYSFSSDADGGLFWKSSNVWGMSSAGTEKIEIASTVNLSTNLRAFDGTEAAPAITFKSDADNGLFFKSANVWGMSSGATEKIEIGSTVNYSTNIRAVDGAEGAPAIVSKNDTNTGIYWNAADDLRFSTGGAWRVALLSAATFNSGPVTAGSASSADAVKWKVYTGTANCDTAGNTDLTPGGAIIHVDGIHRLSTGGSWASIASISGDLELGDCGLSYSGTSVTGPTSVRISRPGGGATDYNYRLVVYYQ